MPMTEQEWLECAEPRLMLVDLEGKASDRKLRLFACACCRSVWHLLKEGCLRLAVNLAEQFADSKASAEELAVASEAAWDTKYRLENVEGEDKEDDALFLAAEAAASASCGPSNDDVALVFRATDAARDAADAGGLSRRDASKLLRDIFGNPFRPVTVDPTWLTPTVVSLAQAAYDERAFDRLPILAAALEDAGCDHADILNHCRQPGEHVRGCWVVDLLLERK
jgi:hypothetical protein